MFEAQAIEHVRSSCRYATKTLPFPPDHKLRNTGLRDHEVDLCFHQSGRFWSTSA